MLRLFRSWFTKETPISSEQPAVRGSGPHTLPNLDPPTAPEPSSRRAEDREELRVRSTATPIGGIQGRLKHKRIYTFGVTQSGQHSTKCRVCHEPNQHVFSIAEDEAGKEHRCCLRCLRQHGGDDQLAIAARRSRYAKRVAECMDALDQLRREFPDPNRRPYGEKSLVAEIELPFMGYEGIERVIAKVKARAWTEYDLAKIDGKSELESLPRRV